MSAQQILLIAALICFFLGAVWGPPANGPYGRYSLVSLGLFFLTIALMVK